MRKLLATSIAMAMMVPSVASACSIYTEPPLPNESDEAYRIRVTALEKERAERWAKQRQASALQQAELIFIARNRDWTPPEKPYRRYQPKSRPGEPKPPVLIEIPQVKLDWPPSDYFKPIAWFRGEKVTDLFKLRTYNTSCGVSGFGDTAFSAPGDLFLFFARKKPLTEDTLIDAIALDKIDNPALMDFVAKYRVKK